MSSCDALLNDEVRNLDYANIVNEVAFTMDVKCLKLKQDAEI
jgi:hypothetical protein